VCSGRNRNAWLLPNCYSTTAKPETADFDLGGHYAERILSDEHHHHHDQEEKIAKQKAKG
jgi:hypothetical protein